MISTIQVIAGILFIALLVLLTRKKEAFAAWTVRAARREKALQVVEQVRLTPQHSLHMIRLADRVMVVAAHSSGCSLLETAHWPLQPEVEPERPVGAPDQSR